jgi:drug/metabolite transporter (DMT)-like permease
LDTGFLGGRVGEAAAVTTAALWGGSALAFSAASRRIGSFRVNQLRLLLACGVLGAALAVHAVVAGALAFPPGPQAALLLASGLVGLTLGDAALFRAFVLLGARRVVLLTALAPVFVAFLAIPLLGERLGAVGVLGMAVTLGGIAWVLRERREDDPPEGHVREGVLLGVVAAFGQAGGAVLAKAGLGQAPDGSALRAIAGDAQIAIDPLVGTFLRMTAGAGALLLWAGPAGRLRGLFQGLDQPGARTLVLVGTVCGPTLGVWLSLVAFAHTDTAVAQTLLSLTPVLILPLAKWKFGERVTARAWLGAAVAVAGAAVLAFR